MIQEENILYWVTSLYCKYFFLRIRVMCIMTAKCMLWIRNRETVQIRFADGISGIHKKKEIKELTHHHLDEITKANNIDIGPE